MIWYLPVVVSCDDAEPAGHRYDGYEVHLDRLRVRAHPQDRPRVDDLPLSQHELPLATRIYVSCAGVSDDYNCE